MCCHCSRSGFSDGKCSAKHCSPMAGLCGLRDWLLGAALGCATIFLILGRIFSGLNLLGTSGKTVGRTDRNSASTSPLFRRSSAWQLRWSACPQICLQAYPSFPESNASPLPLANQLGDSGLKLSSRLPAAISPIGCSGTNRIRSCRGDF